MQDVKRRMSPGIMLSAMAAAGLLLAGAPFLERAAHAHSQILPGGTLVPRNTNPGNKSGPCGTVRSTNVNVLQPGQQINFQWEETIDHPGYYRIAFSPANDAGFDQNVIADNLPDVQGGTLPHMYSQTITIPTTPCENCTLQLIQYMAETNPPTMYYSCADIAIRAASATPSPTPTATSAPAPRATQPTPTATDCH